MMKKYINLAMPWLAVAPLVNTHEFIKFLLTQWSGAPAVIHIFGLVGFGHHRCVRVEVKPDNGQNPKKTDCF
jgi:hypothetical protein